MITTATILHLLAAIATVESNNNDRAVGDGGQAHGRYQMHAYALHDVNRVYNLGYSVPDLYVQESAEWAAVLYLQHYGRQLPRAATLEDLARIWNGGPDGWKERSTLFYWAKVRHELYRVSVSQPLQSPNFILHYLCPPTPTKSSPVVPSTSIPDTVAGSSSRLAPAIFFFSVSNGRGATDFHLSSPPSTTKPNVSAPARPRE